MRKKFLLVSLFLIFILSVLHHDFCFIFLCSLMCFNSSQVPKIKVELTGETYLLYFGQFSYALSHIKIRYSNSSFFCIYTPYRSILVFTDELSPRLRHQLHFLASQDA